MNPKKTDLWNASIYDKKMNFVTQYGQSLIGILSPQEGENILDIGCGPGDLCQQMADHGANPTGIDFSANMIAKAQQKYPALTFIEADARTYTQKETYDAIFSNAALHWIQPMESVVERMFANLKPNGRLIVELGGEHNVKIIRDALYLAFSRRNLEAILVDPWHFPTIAEYCTMLEDVGFQVHTAHWFSRPTPFPDGEEGMSNWLSHFAASFFAALPANFKQEIIEEVVSTTKQFLFDDKQWIGDYHRLRIVAQKK